MLSASLLATTQANVFKKTSLVDGLIHSFHIDVMDGKFVSNNTQDRFSPKFVSKLNTKSKKFVHLMVEKPENYFEQYAKAGSDMIAFHFEASTNPKNDLLSLKKLSVKAGIAFNPKTLETVIDDLISYVDFILVMTVEPGFGGQKLIPETLEKVKKIREKYPQLLISVDGGVNSTTIRKCAEAGANLFVAGTAIFEGNEKENVETLERLSNSP